MPRPDSLRPINLQPLNSSHPRTTSAKSKALNPHTLPPRGKLSARYDKARLRHALEYDLTLPVQLVINSTYFCPYGCVNQPSLEAMIAQLERDGFAVATRFVNLTKGSRHKDALSFVCKSSKISQFAGWNLRQLSGCAAIRHGLNILPSNWNLRALERTNIPDLAIPDVVVHPPHLLPAAAFNQGIALEWDSGSATRSTLLEKAVSYAKVARCQLWATGSLERAATLLEILRRVLPSEQCGAFAVDWRVGGLLGYVLPHTSSLLSSSLERVMPNNTRWTISR
jgi:hypothetical protein